MNQRKSNLELLRIVSMCGIIAMHYLQMGKAIDNYSFPSFSWFLNDLVRSISVPLVNCFVLIAGYFQIKKSTFSLRKPIELLLITLFYGFLSWVIAVSFDAVELTGSSFIEAVFPFIIGKRWFVETYIILILFSPFLNVLLRSIKRSHFQILLGIQLSIFCVWYSLGYSSPLLDDGYGITNFITLYMLGGYLRLYSDCVERASKSACAIVYASSCLASFVLNYFVNPFGYAFFTNILGSVACFVLFLKWDLGCHSAVNKISAATFDVYFVHSDFNTAFLLFSGLLGTQYITNTPWIIPHLAIVIPLVWLLGYCFHILRTKIFSLFVTPLLGHIPIIDLGY